MPLSVSRPQAPPFPLESRWLNVDSPLLLSELAGKAVLLYFWTYSSIECLSILPALQKLQKHSTGLVIVGVHCPRFPAERKLRNLQNIAWQYELTCPLLNDHAFETWKAYSIRDWPTFVFIDHSGRIASYVSGRESVEFLEHQAERLHQECTAEVSGRQLPLPRRRRHSGPLHFPSGVLVHAPSQRIFISDTGHHRVLICDLAGKCIDTIGSGAASRQDGTFEQVAFSWPRGLAVDEDHLYVADTGNHLLRRCNLGRRIVSTVAGTGEQQMKPRAIGPGKPLQISLSSPWGLCRLQRTLFITMPGLHQVWLFDLVTQEIGTYAGTGFPGRIDGPYNQAGFAQPTGLTSDSNCLYVTDSDASAVRRLSVDVYPEVTTLIGRDPFNFGDEDGAAETARLQHPSGIVFADGQFLLADSYNNKIKSMTPTGDGVTIRTRFGSGAAGFKDGRHASFNDPGGLSHSEGKIYVADTNNHAIRVADLTSEEVTTLEIR
ncbi:MAG: alkyl hydroperoxide reductase [Acidobacteria bacterium]|nr:MAG: alkyl hydroperoxide reductase [Acidobacteriota bacterium]